MNLAILVTIVISCICLCLPKSKAACVLMFVFMWSLWGFNLWNGDYVQYMESYYYPKIDSIEIGYQIICRLCSSWLPFQGFLIIISGLVLSGFCYMGIKYTTYPGLYSLIYFPLFILEYVFLRNYICSVLIVYAFSLMIYDDRKITKSLVLILLATSIHIFSICYLPIIVFLRAKLGYKSLMIIVFILIIFTLLISGSFLSSSSYLQSKADFYTRKGGNTISLTTPFHMLIVYISYYIYKHSMTHKSIFKTLRRFMNFNILSMLMIPIYIILPYAATRSLRLLLVFNIFFYLTILANVKRSIYSIGGILFIFLTIGYFFMIQRFDFVVEPLYYCNLLWGYDPNYQLISY